MDSKSEKIMDIFKKKAFLRLAEVHAPHCVSIYLPTDRAGDKNREKNKIRFKNRLKDAVAQLNGFGLEKHEAEGYLKPAYDLADADSDFWGRQSDGLAVFIFNNQLEYYSLPSRFDEISYVADHLYLQPLAGLLQEQARHFILVLSVNNVKFLEATRHTVTPVAIEGLVPQSLTEAVGEDVVQKSLQFRSGETGEGGAKFHGHGSGTDSEKKVELLKFFRQLNEGLMKMLHDESVPMVIACVDYLFPIYQEANTYKHLKQRHVSGNHELTNVLALKELAWQVVRDDFESKDEKARRQFGEFLGAGMASFNLEEIIPAAIGGRTDTLFLRKDAHIWGKYIPAENKVTVDDANRMGNSDLLNKAAIETVRNGGSVYVVDEGKMPDGTSEVNAVFRY